MTQIDPRHADDNDYRINHVYVTKDRALAHFHAQAYGILFGLQPGSGWLYQVEPLGLMEVDRDDCMPECTFAVRQARVIKIVDTHPAVLSADGVQSNPGASHASSRRHAEIR